MVVGTLVLSYPRPTMRAQTPVGPPRGLTWANMASVYLIWGSTYLGTALLIETLPPLAGSGLRFLLAGALLIGIVAIVRGPGSLRITRRQFASTALIGVLLLGVGLGTLSLASSHVPTGIAALVIASVPLWIVLYRMLGGDVPGWRTLLGVAVGMSGLALIALPGGTEAPESGPAAGSESAIVWIIALLGSSAVWAFGSWLSPRLELPADALVVTTYEILVAGVVLLGVGLLRGERFELAQVSGRSWAGLAFLVVFGSVIGYTSFAWLLGHAPLSLVSTYAYVNPAIAVLLGLMFFGEAISADVLIGLTVVLGGVVLVVRGESRSTALLGDGVPAVDDDALPRDEPGAGGAQIAHE